MKIEFDTDNAAFEEDLAGEVDRILRHVAHEVRVGLTTGHVRDVNGNRVGEWSL